MPYNYVNCGKIIAYVFYVHIWKNVINEKHTFYNLNKQYKDNRSKNDSNIQKIIHTVGNMCAITQLMLKYIDWKIKKKIENIKLYYFSVHDS